MHLYLLYRNNLSLSLPYVRVSPKFAKAGEAMRKLLRSANSRWERHKMVATLEAMDDWLLRDIGINPGDIPQVADGLSDRQLRKSPPVPFSSKPVATYDDIYRKAA